MNNHVYTVRATTSRLKLCRGIAPREIGCCRPVWSTYKMVDRRSFLKLASLGTLAGLANCGAPGADLPPVPEASSGTYHLGAGDSVRVITLNSPELTGEFQVGDNGEIALPMVGTVTATGLTPKQLAQAISDRLTTMNLLQKPSLAVEVVRYRPIFVLGEVSKPGQYPYQPGMTAVTAVAVAGGFTYRAVQDRFAVLRVEGSHSVEGRADRETRLQPGDVLTVFERHF